MLATRQMRVASSSRSSMAFTASRVAPAAAVRSVAPARVSAVSAVAQAQAEATKAAPAPKTIHPSPLNTAAPATYAVVEIGGVQMFVEPGKWYTCNRLKADVGSKIKFGRILALKHDGKLTVGQPYLTNVSVEAEILAEVRAPKVIVYKMRPKKHYRKKAGHRQDLTKFMVTKIAA